MTSDSATETPYRQIRALYDDNTITVYQAYSSAIALPAVEKQKLNASPSFKLTRMTWIKPSWCWMMYRCGYSYKDKNQERVLALKMTREGFETLLREASLSHGAGKEEQEKKPVRVQWDPERSPTLQQLPYRSIQIGISRDICERWLDEWIVGIEDVTEKAKSLKEAIDEKPDIGTEDLIGMGVLPEEKEYIVDQDLRGILKMDLVSKEVPPTTD